MSELSEIEDWKPLVEQLTELWIAPEIERRRQRGDIDDSFSLWQAQVLFSDDKPPEVRLNGEVKCILTVRANRAVTKGEPVLLSDLTDIHDIKLIDTEDDYGHITLINVHGTMNLSFDFRRNKIKARELVEKADRFLQCAGLCNSNNLRDVLVDNLFSATELAAKADLIMTFGNVINSHGHISTKINQWRKLGNINDDFVQLFNELKELRDSARYGRHPFNYGRDFSSEIEIVVREVERIKQELKRTSPSDFSPAGTLVV